MWATSCVCMCVCERLLQYDAGRQVVSQDIIMTARHCGEWSSALHLTPSKQLHCVSSPSWKVPCLTGNSDSQQRSTKRATSSGDHPLSFLLVLSPPFFFVLQWSVRMQSSWPFQAEEDNLEGERGSTVPGMFIESSA